MAVAVGRCIFGCGVSSRAAALLLPLLAMAIKAFAVLMALMFDDNAARVAVLCCVAVSAWAEDQRRPDVSSKSSESASVTAPLAHT